MPAVPPGGGQPPGGGATAQQIIEYIQRRLASDPAAANEVTQAYIKYLNDHPRLSPSEGFLAFVFGPVGKNLFKDIGIAIGKGGQLIGGPVVQGTGAGLDQFGKQLTTNPLGLFVSALTSRETIMRIAEGALGAALIVVAVVKITGNTSVIQVAKKVIK